MIKHFAAHYRCALLFSAFFLPSVLLATSPYFIGPDGSPLNLERSTCGSDDAQLMEGQDPQTLELGSPIGILRSRKSNSTGLCSGTLIDKDLFLTARHCKEECGIMSVEFGFLSEKNRGEEFKCREIVEYGKKQLGQDYMIVRLEGSPGVAWGWYPPTDRKLKSNEELMIIHHPAGRPMHISLNECNYKGSYSNGLMSHRCDTLSGSSGSGILTRTDNPHEVRVVGVHAFGGCDSSKSSSNAGPEMNKLVNISATLKSLVKD